MIIIRRKIECRYPLIIGTFGNQFAVFIFNNIHEIIYPNRMVFGTEQIAISFLRKIFLMNNPFLLRRFKSRNHALVHIFSIGIIFIS